MKTKNIKEHWKQLYAIKFVNLEETDTFPRVHNLPQQHGRNTKYNEEWILATELKQ